MFGDFTWKHFLNLSLHLNTHRRTHIYIIQAINTLLPDAGLRENRFVFGNSVKASGGRRALARGDWCRLDNFRTFILYTYSHISTIGHRLYIKA